MTSSQARHRGQNCPAPGVPATTAAKHDKELVIVTGISGAGKASALKAFEDLGYHAVDNLPLELLPNFAALVRPRPRSNALLLSWTSAKGPRWTGCRRF